MQAHRATSATLPLPDRAGAGRLLGEALAHYADRGDVVVLGLPRGGVPVAFEVARRLNAPLDLMLVRKLGTPFQPELAIGAIATGGVRVLNNDIIRQLGIDKRDTERVTGREQQELERRQHAYRGDRALPRLRSRRVILVDDGVATGATMRAAIAALRQLEPARIVVAIPLAPAETVERLNKDADDVICLFTPENFSAIGRWYREFSQISDEEVKAILARAWDERHAPDDLAPGISTSGPLAANKPESET